MDLFAVKKAVSLFLHLIPGALFLSLLALIFLYLSRYKRIAGVATLSAMLLLLIASMPIVSNAFVESLESQIPVMIEPPPNTGLFLTLGNGARSNPTHPANLNLNAVSLARITETLRLWTYQPAASLLLAGPSRHAMRDFAMAHGVPEQNIILQGTAKDTIDEVIAAIEQLATMPDTTGLVIVSSATHLPRTKLILADTQVNYNLAPADFIAIDSLNPFMASAGYLSKTDRAIHERVGILWIKLKRIFTPILPVDQTGT